MLKTLVASIFSVLIVFLVAFFYFSSPSPTGATHILGQPHPGDFELTGYALSQNVGWISFNCSNINDGAWCSTSDDGYTSGDYVSNYKVIGNKISGEISGYAWSSNIGWINFDPIISTNPSSDNYPPQTPRNAAEIVTNLTSTTCDSTFEVRGWIRAVTYGGGWDGWIKMHSTPAGGVSYGVCVNGQSLGGETDEESGYAWGGGTTDGPPVSYDGSAQFVGWVEFNPAFNDFIDSNLIREIPPR